MSLLETIKCLDGKLYNLQWHTTRFNQARKEYFGLNTRMNLANFVKVPTSAKKGLLKCRITYSKTIDQLEFLPHEFRTVESLKLLENNTIDYGYKYSNREELNKLFEQKGDCDDILIVKNGFITDSYTANPIFFDGEIWWTPDTPLLPGTQRARLISEHKISVCPIRTTDLGKYKKVGLINALQDMNDMPIIDIDNILIS